MRNLLKETEEALRMYGYTWDDVVQVQGEEKAISVNRFRELADIKYPVNDRGFTDVAYDLVLMMKDGSWFDRYAEYVGAGNVVEDWRYHQRPDLIEKLDDFGITRVWVLTDSPATPTLARMNGGNDDDEEESKEE